MPAHMKSHANDCGFYIKYAAFHLRKLCHEEMSGAQGFLVFFFMSNYMYFFNKFNVYVQPI